MEDKEFYKQIQKESKKYSDKFEDGFCNFCLKIYFSEFSEDEIENSIFGLGGNDDSIDSFLIDEDQKIIHFSQFKTSRSLSKLSSLKKEWLSYFFDIPNKLANNEYISKHKNSKVVDIAADYNPLKKKYKTKFHFFHLGYNPNESLIDSYKALKYYDFNEIREQYLEYLSKKSQTEPEQINVSLTYDDNPEKIEKKIGNHYTFISLLTGNEIVRLREEFKYKLFDKNLRFSLGNNKINTAIVESALKNQDKFYFYNNGITITSTSFKYRKNNNSVRIEYPQIINGAQTVNAIHSAYKQRVSKLKRQGSEHKIALKIADEEFQRIKVLFRIIQNQRKNTDLNFERKVIEYNNTQNAIKKRDFYANAPEQIELQKYFDKYGYFYEIKRGDRDYISKKNRHNLLQKTLNDFQFKNEKRDIENLASLWMAYYVQETTSKEVGKDRIFGENKFYDLVFPTTLSEIDDNLVKEMILAYNLYDLIVEEARIYRGVNSIMSLLSKIEVIGNFEKAHKIITESSIFNRTLKKKFQNIEVFKSNKETYVNKIKKYTPLSSGKYVILACFRLIIDECGYRESLVNKTELFKNKPFLKENLIKPWLPIILDEFLIPEYNIYMSEIGGSVNAFYHRSKTYDSIKAKFKGLDIDKDKDFNEIFELKI